MSNDAENTHGVCTGSLWLAQVDLQGTLLLQQTADVAAVLAWSGHLTFDSVLWHDYRLKSRDPTTGLQKTMRAAYIITLSQPQYCLQELTYQRQAALGPTQSRELANLLPLQLT
jgi:hypothetical protein